MGLSVYAGKQLRDFDGKIIWKLNIDSVVIAIIDTGKADHSVINCVGFDGNTLEAIWELGGMLVGERTGWDGIVNISISLEKQQVLASTFSGYTHTIDHLTGRILKTEFRK